VTSRSCIHLGLVFLLCVGGVAIADPQVPPLVRELPFNRPLRFEVLGDGVEVPPMELEYDLSQAGTLKIAGIDIEPKSMFALLIDGKGLDARLTPTLAAAEARQKYFIFSWPELLIPEGQLEMISRSGKVVWSLNVNADVKKSWQTQLKIFRDKMAGAGVSKADIEAAKLSQISLAVPVNSNPRKNFVGVQHEPYRFCLSKTEENGYSRLCTSLYETHRNGKAFKIVLFPISKSPARVIAFNEVAPLQKSFTVTKGQLVQFFAEIESGISYEFVGEPSPINLVEMIADKGGERASLTAWGPKPMQVAEDLNVEETGYFTEVFGFQQTIGDLRNFWQTKISLKNPVIYLPGIGGGCFKQKFVITKLPDESLRIFADENTIDTTYVDSSKIFARKRRDLLVSSSQNSLKVEEDESNFTWYFGAKNRGKTNKSYLLLKDGDRQFKVYHEMYKGYPREISSRMSGIISSEGKMVLMGELAFQYWFQDVMGWNNYYLSRHRWGVNAKYFQSLSDFALGNVSELLKVTTVDLKYRFTPGIWNRDETWGALLGYEQIQYSTFTLPIFGGGVFWARSMPRVFDELFNIVPLMRYPKWVDAEFIYYFLPGNTGIQVNIPNYALNFHGKVMWTKSFFGEAGFGLKQYNIDDKNRRRNLTFGSLYGTAGLGLNF
jgi:hypothetical protein